MCLSPIGDKLRTRMRNFPSLVNCTSPIWVQPWARSALKEVALASLQNDAEDMQLDENMIECISEICLEFHLSVEKMTEIYLNEIGKFYYVTPLSYLKLLRNFK